MNTREIAGRFFSVIAEPRTWGNVAYIWLAFPLGLLYLIVLSTGTALTIGLSLLWIGLLLGVALLGLMRGLTHFERSLSQTLLGEALPTVTATRGGSVWKWFRGAAGSIETWKGVLFLFLKFPLGVASWVASVILFSVSGALMATPFAPDHVAIELGDWTLADPVGGLLAALVGVLLLFVTLHAHNGMGKLWKLMTRILLSSSTDTPANPPQSDPPAVAMPGGLQMA